MNLVNLIALLKVLYRAPTISVLHDEVVDLVLKKIKKELELKIGG